MEQNLRDLGPFRVTGEETTVGQRWKDWITVFEAYMGYKGTTVAQAKLSSLLYLGGSELRQVIEALENRIRELQAEGLDEEANIIPGLDAYAATKRALNNYFQPKINHLYTRFKFYETTPMDNETTTQYVTRLLAAAKLTNFDNKDAMVIDMVIKHTRNEKLRLKLIEEGHAGLTLERLCTLARIMEIAEFQAREINKDISPLIAKIDLTPKTSATSHTIKCFRCNKLGHVSRDQNCPARDKVCNKCKKRGHFSVVCEEYTKRFNEFIQGKNVKTKIENSPVVHHVEELPGDRTDDYVFQLNNGTNNPSLSYIIICFGGVKLKCLIDSGATCNVINFRQFQALRERAAIFEEVPITSEVKTFANGSPLKVVKKIRGILQLEDKKLVDTFYVIDATDTVPILGIRAATTLEVLRVGKLHTINHVSESQRLVERIKTEFPNVVSGIGRIKGFEVKLEIDKNVTPVQQPLRRYAIHLLPKIEAELQKLLDDDIIERVNEPSEWISPLVVGQKPNGDLRLIVDAREINKAIKRRKHPIPSIEEVRSQIHGSKLFAKVDLNKAFHQVTLHESSRYITTFSAPGGLYRYKTLNFGLTSASEEFQAIMDTVKAKNEGTESYIDDWLVHAKTKEILLQRLWKLFHDFNDLHITINLDKLIVLVIEIEFRGYIFTQNGIKPLNSKVDDLKNFKEPETPGEAASFLGLATYFTKFIQNFSSLVKPIRMIANEQVPFSWGDNEKTAKIIIIKHLTSAPILAYFIPGKPINVFVDAGPMATGAVLLQLQNYQDKVIEYASKSLTPVEQRYSQIEKEALAIYHALTRFKYYLLGAPRFMVTTDHKPLIYIFNKTMKVSVRIERWILRLQEFDFVVEYRPGKLNIADSLSRLTVHNKHDSKTEGEDYVCWVVQQAVPAALSLEEVQEASAEDLGLKALRLAISTNKWPTDLRIYELIRNELTIYDQIVLRGPRIVVPVKLRNRVIALAHEGHLGIVKTKQRLRSKVWWPNIDYQVEKFCKSCTSCQLVSTCEPPTPLTVTQLPDGPWLFLGIDYLGPLPTGEYILVIVDYYSKFLEAVFTNNVSSSTTIEKLRIVFTNYGYPTLVRVDNGGCFISAEFKRFCDNYGIQITHTTPRYPQANGEVERQNRSIVKRLKIAAVENKNLQSELLDYLVAYRTTPHPSTGKTPAYLMFGRELKDKIPSISTPCVDASLIQMHDTNNSYQRRIKENFDRRHGAQDMEITTGDTVLLKSEKQNKLSTAFLPEKFTVVAQNGNNIVAEGEESGKIINRNVTHCKKFIDRDESSDIPIKDEQSDQSSIMDSTPLSNSDSSVRSSGRIRRIPSHLKDFHLY